MIDGMSTCREFAGIYARYAEECLELGVRPLPPEELFALLDELLSTRSTASMLATGLQPRNS
jgi:hypothetical protein